MTNASLTTIIVNFLPLWLLALGVVLLLVEPGRPILRRKTLDFKQAEFKSLRTASPILNALVMTSVGGKPFLEHRRRTIGTRAFSRRKIIMPLTVIFIISLYALIVAIISSSFGRSKTSTS